MKRAVLLVSVIYVGAVGCASCLTLSLLLSEINSQSLMLTLFSLGYLSLALMVTLVLLVTCFTTKRQGGLNRLHHLKVKEREIAERIGVQRIQTSDWKSQELELLRKRMYSDFNRNK